MELNGRVAVVTGGSSGIGRATVQKLSAAGARVVDWSIEDGADVRCDVADPEEVERALEWTIAHVGVPSLLVTSAGVGEVGPTLEITMAEWDRVFDVNVRGTFLAARAVARELIARGLDGSMVLISSVNGSTSDPMMLLYSMSKAAVNQMAKIFAAEFGPHGIRCNAIGPGPTDTPIIASAIAHEEILRTIVETTPLGRLGEAEDIAEAVVGTMRMSWVTGQSFLADGGAALMTPRAAVRARFMAGGVQPRTPSGA